MVDVNNTKFSDIDLAFVKNFLRIEAEFIEDDVELTLLIEAAKDFVLEHSQMTLEELDNVKRANIIFLKVVSDLYSNRSATSGGSIEPIFEIMLKNLRNYTNVFGTPEV